MNNKGEKSREELEAELAVLRRQVAELEARLASVGGHDVGPVVRPPRSPMDAAIECIGDFDVLQARGVNISEEGICFELAQGLPFEMRFDHEGQLQRRRAYCVWLRRQPVGTFQLGLRFAPLRPWEEF